MSQGAVAAVAGVPAVDPGTLSHVRRMALLVELERTRAVLDALQQRTLAALARSDRSDKQWVRDEVACALRVSPAVAGVRLTDARDLVDLLPATVDALGAARLGVWHTRALLDETRSLRPDVHAAVEARVLDRGALQTVPQFRASVRRTVARLDAGREDERQAAAVAARRVVETRRDDGTAEIWSVLAVADSARVMDRVRRRAHLLGLAERGDPAPRTLDQRRADALVDLVLGRPAPPEARGRGGEPAAGEPADDGTDPVDVPMRMRGDGAGSGTGRRARSGTPVVQVIMSLDTLAGLRDGAAELAGYGPIGTTLARRIASDPDAVWQPVVVDGGGSPVRVGAGYRPPAALRRLVCTRDRTCRFPGCRRRAEACELDHIVDWDDGGPTEAANLHALCPRHHHLKHEAPGWRVDRDDAGATTWTGPAGIAWTVPPADTG